MAVIFSAIGLGLLAHPDNILTGGFRRNATALNTRPNGAS
jgi:hypothetical protein